MDKNIYKLLNEVEMELNDYESESVSKLEIKKIQKYVQKHEMKIGSRNKIAAVAALLCLATGVLFSNEVYAFVSQIGYKISYIWDLNNVDKYVNVVNTSQQDNGYTITLNEVILDHDELIICQTVRGDERLPRIMTADGTLKIDGKRIDEGGGGGGKPIDEYTYEEIFYHRISDSYIGMNDSHEIQYSISEITVFTDSGMEKVKGNWSFRFTVTGEELKKDTVNVDMDDTVAISDKHSIVFEQYSANMVNQKIYFHCADNYEDFDYDMELRGYDDLGNQVVFYMSSFRDNKGVFEVETSVNGCINEEAKRLVLSLYIVEMPVESGNSVYEEGVYETEASKAGQEITINIVK